jgi:NADH:ubiquinone oxidoreductase subunit 5 (subunit L)/multisubunit Na+/H+ antiporter MnhA subunit
VERRREVNVAKKPRKRTVKLEADYLEKGDSDGGEVEEEEEEEEEINEFENNEIDEMVYEDAVQYDKRKFTKVFSRNILQKMFFTGPFMSIHAIEPFFVRLLTFFLLLALYYALNGLFFSEAYISNTFASEGNNKVKFFIKHQLPMCILAAFIGAIVTALIMLFAFSRRRFMTVIEEEKDHESFLKRTHKVMRCLKIRLVIFVVLDVILMLAFWYYVSAFGAVYQKSQIPLLIGMVITVVFVLIFQIIYALLVTLMRYIGLKCKCLCLYTLSTYLL